MVATQEANLENGKLKLWTSYRNCNVLALRKQDKDHLLLFLDHFSHCFIFACQKTFKWCHFGCEHMRSCGV